MSLLWLLSTVAVYGVCGSYYWNEQAYVDVLFAEANGHTVFDGVEVVFINSEKVVVVVKSYDELLIANPSNLWSGVQFFILIDTYRVKQLCLEHTQYVSALLRQTEVRILAGVDFAQKSVECLLSLTLLLVLLVDLYQAGVHYYLNDDFVVLLAQNGHVDLAWVYHSE